MIFNQDSINDSNKGFNMVSIKNMINDETGQLHTIEVSIAVLILFGALIYATFSAPVNINLISNEDAELNSITTSVLDTLNQKKYKTNSPLKEDIITWDGKTHDTTDDMDSNIKKTMDNLSKEHDINYNVYFEYTDSNNTQTSTNYIFTSPPESSAVASKTSVLLSDSDVPDNFTSKIPDTNNTTNFYNIVDVKVVIWND